MPLIGPPRESSFGLRVYFPELEACKIYLCSDAMPEYLDVEGDRCLPVLFPSYTKVYSVIYDSGSVPE